MAVKHDMLQDGGAAANKGKETSDNKVLSLLRLIRTNPDNLQAFCNTIVEILCQEPFPKDKDGIKQFNETMVMYKKQLADICSTETQHSQIIINECLNNLRREMVTSAEIPSVAASIVLTLFNSNALIPNAVKWMLSDPEHSSDAAIQRVVECLCQWICTTTCTPSINLWITEILAGLFEERQFELLRTLSLNMIVKLVSFVRIPVFRPQILPVIHAILVYQRREPKLFHFILPWLPDMIKSFKGQLGEKEIHLLNTIKELMYLFPVTDNRYQEIEQLFDLIGEQQLCISSSSSLAAAASNNPRVGLVNMGNTCYMNSILQALVMTKQFSREILLSNMSQWSKTDLVFHIQKLLAQLLHSRRPELTPREVLHAARPPGFLPGHQQDSSEFLGHLLDTLHEQELNLRRKRVNNSDLMDTEEADEDGMMEYENEEATSTVGEEKADQTLIQRTFGGTIAIVYKCLSCGLTSTNKDSFRDIPLAFPDKMGQQQDEGDFYVQSLVDYYCSTEKLEGENKYFCDKCEKLCDGLRSIHFVAPPRNLILTLKHFKYDQQCHTRAKLMHNVYHNESVQLKVYPTGVAASPNSQASSSTGHETTSSAAVIQYNLYAAVVHSGMSMDAGHYYTYASDQPNSWYKFNDNYVTRCSIEDLHRLKPPNSPYILFYKMATDCWSEADANALPGLDELPLHLRDFVDKDNYTYCQEMQGENERAAAFKAKHVYNSRDGDDDSDDRDPPNSCGGNAIDHCNSYIC